MEQALEKLQTAVEPLKPYHGSHKVGPDSAECDHHEADTRYQKELGRHRALHIVKLLQTDEALQEEFDYLQTDSWELRVAGLDGERALARYLLYNPQTKVADRRSMRKHAPLLDAAARVGLIELVEFFLHFMVVDVSPREQCATHALVLALLHTQHDVAERLIALGADVKHPELLNELVQTGRRSVLEQALHLGADPTTLRIDAAEFHLGTASLPPLRFLVSVGADVNRLNAEGDTLLQLVLWLPSTTRRAEMQEHAIALLRYGADPNIYQAQYWRRGMTPFHFAITLAMPDLLDAMLARGMRINGPDGHGEWKNHPLATAAEQNDAPLVERLLALGAAPEAEGPALESAARAADPAVFEAIATTLLAWSADDQLRRSVHMKAALHSAAIRRGDVGMVDFLLAEMAKGDTQCMRHDGGDGDEEEVPVAPDGASRAAAARANEVEAIDHALAIAIWEDQVSMAVKLHTQLQARNLSSRCLLANLVGDVILRGRAGMAGFLLAHLTLQLGNAREKTEQEQMKREGKEEEESVDRTRYFTQTMLDDWLVCAAKAGLPTLVKTLLDRGAAVNRDAANLENARQKDTALRAAAAGGHMAVVKILVEEGGADVNPISALETDALSEALYHKHREVFEYLFARPELALSPSPVLHIAAYRIDDKTEEVLRRLLDRGANVNAQLPTRGTPLLAAAGKPWDCTTVAQLLLARGADVNAQSGPHNGTALQAAARQGNLKMVRLLLAHGADANLKDARRRETTLHAAAAGGHLAVVKVLVEEGGASVLALAKDALSLELYNKHRSVFKYLAARPELDALRADQVIAVAHDEG